MDLRCYGLTSPRHDGKICVNFADIDDFTHEWVLDDLPWDAVTSIRVGDKHPELLDQKLVEAIIKRALPDDIEAKAKMAAVAFLYLYMVMVHGGER